MISVIVPVYNTEKYLDQCIQSILAQTYTDFELLLIDDGSTDSSGAICDKYAAKDSRVRVFHKPNGGVSSARNMGLENAKGEWIGWVDSDDYIAADMYEKLYAAATSKNADIAYCNYAGKWSVEMPSDTISIADFINQYLFCPINSLCVMLAKRRLFMDNNVYFMIGNNLGEDLFVTTKLYYFANFRVYVPQKLYYYRDTPCSITNSNFDRNSCLLLNNIIELHKFLNKTEIYEQIKPNLASRILSSKQVYLYGFKDITKWYSISTWTHRYIFMNPYNGIKGKVIEWCMAKLYRLCLTLITAKMR